MSVEFVALGYLPGGPWVALREIAGCDEAAVTGHDANAAIQLLDRLLDAERGDARLPGGAIDLTVSDRDRLLAAVYTRTYGARIENTLHCPTCDQPFDLDFSLVEMGQRLEEDARRAAVEPVEDGTFRLSSGLRFRLPTGRDERAVSRLLPAESAAALLARCLVDGDAVTDNGEDIQTAMEAVGPLLNLDLGAACPECGAEQEVHFDIQSYLLGALAQDRPGLALDIHRLATAYGWSREEILSIPRGQRRAYVALVEADAAARVRRSA
jgi:hypothetical protein